MSNRVDYWLGLCDDDILTAKALLEKERLLHMGFFCHLIVEKALKAVIASQAVDEVPKIHNLVTLAKRCGIETDLTEEQFNLLERLNPLHIETRYPVNKSEIAKTLTHEKCQMLYDETEVFLCWIKQRLGR